METVCPTCGEALTLEKDKLQQDTDYEVNCPREHQWDLRLVLFESPRKVDKQKLKVRLRKARLKAKLSQKQVGQIARCSHVLVSVVESAKKGCSPEMARRLLDAVGDHEPLPLRKSDRNKPRARRKAGS